MNDFKDIAVVLITMMLVSFLILLAATAKVRPLQGTTAVVGSVHRETRSVSIGKDAVVIEVMRKTLDDQPDSQHIAVPIDVSLGQAYEVLYRDYVYSIDAAGLREAISDISVGVRDCYLQWRSLDHLVGIGAWETTFTFEDAPEVEAVRRVTDVYVHHRSTASEVMEQCLMEMFQQLRFELGGPDEFDHPLAFKYTRQ